MRSVTGKLVEARNRIKALSRKTYDVAERLVQQDRIDEARSRRSESLGLDLAVRVIEDLLQN